MRKFLSKIFIFSLAFFVLEKVFFIFLYISPSLEVDQRLEDVVNGQMNKDLIVLGSSRGARNIIAGQIEDSLNISCYNLSYPGSNIEFHEFMLRSLIKFNHNPKVILLAIDDPAELLPDETINFRLDRLYPLAKYNHVNNEMINRGEKTFLSRFLVLARINKRNFNLNRKRFSAFDSIITCGSMPLFHPKENKNLVFRTTNTDYYIRSEAPEKVDAFNEFQNMCIAANIKLYLVFSPNFKNSNVKFEQRIKELSHPNVSFIHYERDNRVYKNQDCFQDEAHLKANGAKIFTAEIIRHLKKSSRLN